MTVPYYQDDAVTIYHGDCLDVLLHLPIKAHLAFADPPYNSNLTYGAGTDDTRTDYWEWLTPRIGVLLSSGEVVLVKHSALKIAPFVQAFPGRVLVWYKPFSSGYPLNGVATHWEPIHWLKGKSSTWSKDVFECSSGNTHREGTQGHPAQFPERLASWLIQTFSPPGGIVLDAFAGSGTMLVAAKSLGRKAVGIEIEERYCELAATRCAQEVLDIGAIA